VPCENELRRKKEHPPLEINVDVNQNVEGTATAGSDLAHEGNFDVPEMGDEGVVAGGALPATQMSAPAMAGSLSVQVRSTAGFFEGMHITIGSATDATREVNMVEALSAALLLQSHPDRGAGSTMHLAEPLEYTHPAGTPITGSVSSLPALSPAPAAAAAPAPSPAAGWEPVPSLGVTSETTALPLGVPSIAPVEGVPSIAPIEVPTMAPVLEANLEGPVKKIEGDIEGDIRKDETHTEGPVKKLEGDLFSR
jgi:hypothetical protein